MTRPLDIAQLAEAAGVPLPAAQPYAPLLALLDALVEERIGGGHRTEPAGTSRPAAEAIIAAIEEGLHPDHDYLPAQAAAFLGVEVSTYHSIPRHLLPRRKGGYARGVWIMAYRGDVTREEAQAYLEARRAAVLRHL